MFAQHFECVKYDLAFWAAFVHTRQSTDVKAAEKHMQDESTGV